MLELGPRRRPRPFQRRRIFYAQALPTYGFEREVVVERSPLPAIRYRGSIKRGEYLYGISAEDVCMQAGRARKKLLSNIERLDADGWGMLRCGCDSVLPCR